MKRTTIVSVLTLPIMLWAVCAGAATTSDLERLGMYLYKDTDLSFNGTQSCQNCHHPLAGFADRTNQLHPDTKVVSTGADGVSQGGRNAPGADYAGFSPILNQGEDGQWVGGMFWDGRATGLVLGDPLAEQAQGPPLNPVEMAMEDEAAVIEVVRNSTYASLFLQVFGADSLDEVDPAFDNFGRALAAYERSAGVTQFTSKYDIAFDQLTDQERRGLDLFTVNCSRCHSATVEFGAPAPLFTNYRYANIGVPANLLVVLANPDIGLGATVNDPAQNGKFKTPTLRNIALSPPYSHNGSFPTLSEMVAFLNDSSAYVPEVLENIDPGVGNMGLSDSDVADLVAFLTTLTDGYQSN